MKILVNGAFGKMGKCAVDAIKNDERFQLSAGIGRQDSLSQSIKTLTPDIVVDLTCASAGFENAKTILSSGAHAVLGTSGFLDEHRQELSSLCKTTNKNAIIAPNFSISAVLMMHFSKQAAQYFSRAEIIEMHHHEKQESPSGTAIKTAELIAESLESTLPDHSSEIIEGARGARLSNVNIHSVRMPGFIAHQCVLFGARGETLTIKQDTLDREAFMPGLLLACQHVSNRPGLTYGLEAILFG